MLVRQVVLLKLGEAKAQDRDQRGDISQQDLIFVHGSVGNELVDSGNDSQFAIEHGPVEIVSFPMR